MEDTDFKKFEGKCSAEACHIPWNFLKAAFHKFYFVHFTSTNFTFTLSIACSICFILRFFLLLLTSNDLIFLHNKRKYWTLHGKRLQGLSYNVIKTNNKIIILFKINRRYTRMTLITYFCFFSWLIIVLQINKPFSKFCNLSV